jgi:hypothetical protein
MRREEDISSKIEIILCCPLSRVTDSLGSPRRGFLPKGFLPHLDCIEDLVDSAAE